MLTNCSHTLRLGYHLGDATVHSGVLSVSTQQVCKPLTPDHRSQIHPFVQKAIAPYVDEQDDARLPFG
jgi:hypothetical protein